MMKLNSIDPDKISICASPTADLSGFSSEVICFGYFLAANCVISDGMCWLNLSVPFFLEPDVHSKLLYRLLNIVSDENYSSAVNFRLHASVKHM